jgi:hypothetical protein
MSLLRANSAAQIVIEFLISVQFPRFDKNVRLVAQYEIMVLTKEN